MNSTARPVRRKRVSNVQNHHQTLCGKLETHPAKIDEWIWNHKEVEEFKMEYDTLIETQHRTASLFVVEADNTTTKTVDVNPTNINVSNMMLTVKEFDLPKLSIQSIYDMLMSSEDVTNMFHKHMGTQPSVDFSRFANCIEIHSKVRDDNISIKVFTDNTSHITGFNVPSVGLDLAWMMHQIISSMHSPDKRRSHVCVSFDNVHADFSMNLPANCVMNTMKMRELVNEGALDQFENEDFEFVHVRPDYRFVSRNKREYTGVRINITFRLYNNVYQVCVTPFATGNCIIRSKHPEAITKICIVMIKFFALASA